MTRFLFQFAIWHASYEDQDIRNRSPRCHIVRSKDRIFRMHKCIVLYGTSTNLLSIRSKSPASFSSIPISVLEASLCDIPADFPVPIDSEVVLETLRLQFLSALVSQSVLLDSVIASTWSMIYVDNIEVRIYYI